MEFLNLHTSLPDFFADAPITRGAKKPTYTLRVTTEDQVLSASWIFNKVGDRLSSISLETQAYFIKKIKEGRQIFFANDWNIYFGPPLSNPDCKCLEFEDIDWSTWEEARADINHRLLLSIEKSIEKGYYKRT